MISRFKRSIVGSPLATEDEQHQRLGIPTALAVFASDAISSTAYASQEILLVLIPVAGLSIALDQLIPISIIVMVLLVLVITSYRQTIFAYPGGGGSYVVSRENLGETPALVAGASLLVDYILTVAVSVSAGVAAITSAFPALRPERVEICLGFIAIMTMANLRGMKESGRLFAGPTYVYIVASGALIVVGLFRLATGALEPMAPNTEAVDELTGGNALTGLTVLLFLRAFSSGAVALTGIEAISNGVPAFKKPESKHAATTLLLMGTILATFFFGISVLASRLRPTPSEGETLLSIMGREVFNGESLPYYVLQFSTFAILILAANTAFADFPRVSSILSARTGSAGAAQESWRSAGVLQRDPHARGGGGGLDRGVLGRHEQADPPVRRRRVLRVHALADRHGAPPPEGTRARLATRSDRQLDRSGRHVHRVDRGPRVEVHDRRMDPGGPDPDHRVRVQADQTSLRQRSIRTAGRTGRPRPPPLAHGGDPGRQRESRGVEGRCVCRGRCVPIGWWRSAW